MYGDSMQFHDVVTKQLEYFKEYFGAYQKLTEQQAITPKKHKKKRNNNNGLGYNLYRTGEQHLIENYSNAKQDNFKYWHLHHRLELTLNGEVARSRADLIRLGVYYNRPYFELIYLPQGVHSTIHTTKNPKEREMWVNYFKM